MQAYSGAVEEATMIFAGNYPRLKLYTSLKQYLGIVRDAASRKDMNSKSIGQLEEEFRKRVNTKYGGFLPMARVGIYLAVKALIKPGEFVILSPYTISDVVNMVICAGGIPLFVDIDRATCNISFAEIQKALDSGKRSRVGAVLVTHFYGCACDIEAISSLCQGEGIPLVEDCAQAFGAKVSGRSVGSFGDAGVFSFGLYKNLNCFLGGMLVTNRLDLMEQIQKEVHEMSSFSLGHYLKFVVKGIITDLITWPPFFRAITFRIFRFGLLNNVDSINNKLKIDIDPKIAYEVPKEYLYNPTGLQAQQVLDQLPLATRNTEARIERARLYYEGLKEIGGLLLPPPRFNGDHVYWHYPLQFSDREQLVKFAMEEGSDISMSYHRNCAEMKCFSDYAQPCREAEATANSVIYLPTYPSYPLPEAKRIIATIRTMFGA